MATRLKTIEYAFETDTTLRASAVRLDFAAITAYIPEKTGTITFKSVVVKVFTADSAAVVQSLTNWIIGIKLGAVAFDDATVTDTITNSGEAQTYMFTRDVTSYFTTNWGAGTSQTMQVGCSFAGGNTLNTWAKVLITYEYDDSQTTHIKTVRVPIESTRATLSTSYQTIGGATAIPAFKGSYLPENSIVVRQVWIELFASTNIGTTADLTVTARINGADTKVLWVNESALSSATWASSIWDITAQTLTSDVSLEATSTVSARIGQYGGMVCCTYEYNDSASTTIFNSLLIGAYDSVGTTGGTTEADRDCWGRTIFIEEPGTITLKESGVILFGMDTATSNMHVAVGSQVSRAYTTMGNATNTGQYSWVHRIDAGGQVGTAGITLGRGKNDYKLYIYTTTANQGWNVNGLLILNYTSGRSASTSGAHAHSIRHQIADTGVDEPVKYYANNSVQIPETNYWINSIITESNLMNTATSGKSVVIAAERKTGEAEESGWEILYAGTILADSENSLQTTYGASRKQWKRWTGDVESDRLDVEVARRYKTDMTFTSWSDLALWVTYHTISFTTTLTIAGSAGGTVQVQVFRSDDNSIILETSRVGNGTVDLTWYDNTVDVYVDCYEDSTHLGRSALFKFGD